MSSSNASSATARYAVALVSVAVGLALRLALEPVFGASGRLTVFVLAVLVSVRLGGRGPGIAATALSLPLAWFFFINPRFATPADSIREAVSLVLLAAAGLGISLLVQPARLMRLPAARHGGLFEASFLRRTALLGGAFLLLLALTRMLYADFEREANSQALVNHTYQVLNEVRGLMATLDQTVTSQRGYLLSGNPSDLAAFQSAVVSEQAARRNLRRLTADNPTQQTKLATLDQLVEQRVAELQRILSLRETRGVSSAMEEVRSGAGAHIMDQCRTALAAVEGEERTLLTERLAAAETQGTRMRWVLGLGSGSLLILLVIAGAVIERDSQNRERAREQIRRSEQRLRLALDAANAGTWQWDVQTGENVWSAELWKLYGLDPNSCQPSYETWRQAVHPDDRERAAEEVNRAAKAGTEVYVEFRVLDRQGNTRWLLARAQPLRDRRGATRYAGIALDITQRKRVEEALLEREQNLRRFTEVAPVAIAMFDRDMHYLATSQRFREDFRLGSQQLIGRSHYETFPEIPDAWREIHRRCLAGAVERHPGELFRRLEGDDQWIRWEIQPWHGADGEIGGIVLFTEDITEQKRSEESVRESEARLRLAQQVAHIGTFEWNLQSGVTTWTPELESMHGLQQGTFGGTQRAWEDLIHSEDRPEAIRQRDRALETGSFDAEWRIIRPDGAICWMAGRGWVFKDDAGNPQRLIGVNIDITGPKRAEEDLHRTEADLREAQRVARLGSWHWDLATDSMTCSEEVYALCHWDPALPPPDYEARLRMYTDEGRAMLDREVQRTRQTGGGWELDMEVPQPDGSTAWLSSRGEAVKDSSGAIVGLHGTIQDVTRRKLAEDEIRSRITILQAIGDVFAAAIGCETREALGEHCLTIVEKLTGSRFGFIGELNSEGKLDSIAISDPGWEACRIDNPDGPRKAPLNFAVHGIYGRVLLDGKGYFTNDPSSHPERVGVPEGHPPLTAFLGVPLIHGGNTIGMIGLGNRPGGYGTRELEALEALAPAVVNSFMRKRAEDALRDSEAQFRTLANAIPQLCWMANADGWIFWYNQRWYEYTGTTPAQMEGWGWQSVHDPATLPKVLDRWQTSIANGEPFDMVFPLRAADGTFHPFLTRIMPVRNREGKVAGWFGTNTDITEQYMTEAALREASEQRRLAIEAAELGAWDYRFRTGEVFWDERCRDMFGFRSGDRIGYQEALERIHPEDRSRTDAAIRQAVAAGDGGVFRCEFRTIWPDGSVHWIAGHARMHLEGEGERRRPAQLIGVTMDISQRKEAEIEVRLLNTQLEQRVQLRTAQLENANKELEAFAYSVSHDLRAPLRGIDGWSLALAEDYAGQLDQKARGYLDRVRAESQRMGLLIDDMLLLSRVTRSQLQVTPVDLSATARGIAERLLDLHRDRRIEILVEPDLTVTGDARLLDIALTNLLANAVKFTGPRAQARIEFRRRQHNGETVFQVSDNGVGFDMAHAGMLFGAFQRLHKASEFPGTGIGLATVQRVIHRHGGRVWAEAQPGQGATFFFTVGTSA
jgi:PAS domain S-box-containing protein